MGGSQQGFTLIELVVVMVLATILTAVAVPRFNATSDFDALRFREELAAATRYAQKRALSSGCPVQLVLNSTGYALLQPDAFPCSGTFVAVPNPSTGTAFSGAVPSGVAFSATPALPVTVTFNTQGGLNLGSDLLMTVGPNQLRVHRLSGYLQ